MAWLRVGLVLGALFTPVLSGLCFPCRLVLESSEECQLFDRAILFGWTSGIGLNADVIPFLCIGTFLV